MSWFSNFGVDEFATGNNKIKSCPYCFGNIDLKDWSPLTSDTREITCDHCKTVSDIEWDDNNGWYAWLSIK